MDTTASAASVGLVFLLAGAVKGVTGMGLPTVAASLLGLWMAPLEAAALLVAPALVTNVAQCRGPNGRQLAAQLWPAWLTLFVVTAWAPDVGTLSAALRPHHLLGGVLVVYGAWGLWRPAPPPWVPRAAAAGAVAGALTGLVTAATAVFVIPLVPYLQALRLDKDAMVQALGLSFTVATLALAWRLQTAGALATAVSPASALALASAFAGMGLGAWGRARLRPQAFQRALQLVLLGLGVANLLRAG